MTMEQAAESAVMLLLGSIVGSTGRRYRTLKRRASCRFTGALFPFIHLLLECSRFFLIHEGQPRETVLELERMEERAVLVVVKWVVDFLVPDYSAIGRLYGLNIVNITWPSLLTDTSTNLIHSVFPIRSFANTAAPCRPV